MAFGSFYIKFVYSHIINYLSTIGIWHKHEEDTQKKHCKIFKFVFSGNLRNENLAFIIARVMGNFI
jgi:hypothetical protein